MLVPRSLRLGTPHPPAGSDVRPDDRRVVPLFARLPGKVLLPRRASPVPRRARQAPVARRACQVPAGKATGEPRNLNERWFWRRVGGSGGGCLTGTVLDATDGHTSAKRIGATRHSELSGSGRTRDYHVDRSCRLLIVPLFRGSSRFESLILSHHSRFTCECNKEEINDGDDDNFDFVCLSVEVGGKVSCVMCQL